VIISTWPWCIFPYNFLQDIFIQSKVIDIFPKLKMAIIFYYLFHSSCKTGFMPLAACMASLQLLLQLVELSQPYGLSLHRLCESLVMFVYVSIFTFSLLSFTDMSACSVFIAVCLFCSLDFSCILCSYFCLHGVLNLIKPD